MITPKLLVVGKFKPADIDITTAPSNRAIDPTVEAQLETAWNAMLEQASTEGRRIYNGLSYRLNALRQDEARLILELGIFEYKVRDGLVRVPGYFDLPESHYRKGCYTSATVKTADDKYLMVNLSGKSMNMNRVDNLGGIVDAEPEINDGQGIFASLYKELKEEALITEDDIKECYLRAIILERQTNVGLYFEATLNVTAETMLARQQNDHLDEEIASIKVLTRAENIALLQASDVNKQLIASVFAM